MRHTNFVPYLLAIFAGVGAMAAPATVQAEDLFKRACFSTARLMEDQIIQGCSMVIQQRHESGASLATAYYNRGHAYYCAFRLIATTCSD